MNPTIDELAEVCRDELVREKLLFVPSYSIGHQIGEWLARAGTPWINFRVTTPAGYAQERVAIRLSSEGIRFVDSYERFLIVERLYADPDFLKKRVEAEAIIAADKAYLDRVKPLVSEIENILLQVGC